VGFAAANSPCLPVDADEPTCKETEGLLLDDFAGLPIVCSRCKVKKSDNATHVLFRRQPQIERLWRSGLPVAGAAPAFRLEEPAYLIACYSGGRAPRLPRILAARLGPLTPCRFATFPSPAFETVAKGTDRPPCLSASP
jgi:hypothetical protein